MPPRPRFDRRAPVRELPNINERIKYPQLRVVDSDGKQLGVIDRIKALEIADQRGLDLVLVSEKANPPVCRIMDYGKYKFEQEKKANETKKKSHSLVRFFSCFFCFFFLFEFILSVIHNPTNRWISFFTY